MVSLLAWRHRKYVKCFTPCMETLIIPVTAGSECVVKHSRDPKRTSFLQHSHSYLPSYTALKCDSRSEALISRLAWCQNSCMYGSAAVDSTVKGLSQACNMCMLVWLHACIAMWVSAVSVNCYMRPLDLTFELCGLVPVRQNTGCGLLHNLCRNDHTFGGSSCAIFSLNWMSL